jgi:hypothetical protein
LDITSIDDDPNILFDISGQARPSTVTLKDVGCDEFTTGATTNHPLTLSEVGPSYLALLSSQPFDLLDQKTLVFPNPAKNNFTIQFPNNIGSDMEVTITNTNGQVVKKLRITQNEIINNEKLIDITNLNNGIYVVQLYSNSYTKAIKLAISK